MVAESEFTILKKAKNTCCPNCRSVMDILSHDDELLPAFVICWQCKWISEIGIGPVKEIAPLERR